MQGFERAGGELLDAAAVAGRLVPAGSIVAFRAAHRAELLAERGNLDELRTRADAGDRYAAQFLASVLAERGDLNELRTRANVGDRYAASQLAGLLTKQGRDEEAEQLRRFGLNSDGSIASA